ncbi:SIR2 family NAD-dependent protein deacylase [Yinghuangia soli]|uniref:protein acetyllysine N-acetyltransferase n=1 Tax=Yinghuangia soli TaxID=2908204 RepID=A0AA41PW21_9ACTN|nr:Sir2 family NAD-dependent protein deacetylase [Yinghuangia soli]MCF2525954.1 Sir2 family NAD-dependent protein deacetylase [Yinghuangia soli]
MADTLKKTYTRVVALTGAGISTDSGIPDFRGPEGLWTRAPRALQMVDAASFLTDREVRCAFWSWCAEGHGRAYEPNDAHRALVDLAAGGLLAGIVTQNVDGLHQAAGSDPATVHEVHGTMATTCCQRCGGRTATTEVVARVREGETEPLCLCCGGVLKPDAVFFGDLLDRGVFAMAAALAGSCDLMLAAGSSLEVQPAAGLCDKAVAAGADLVIVNAGPTGYDGVATAVLREPIGTALPGLVRDLLADRS